LKRWNIPEGALPPGSAIAFRQPGLWETHRAELLIGLGVLALQTGLILLLVAERRRSRATRDNLALAAEAATIGLWHLDLAEADINASPRWRAIFDLPETGRISFDEVLERLHHEDRFGVRTAIEQALGEGRSFSLEHRVVRRDGGVRWVASHGRAGTGGDRGMHGASRDITERRQALMEANQQRAELAHLSRVSSLGVLSGALAHELNQPLGTILSNAQAARHLLVRDEPDLAEIREIIDDIISEDRRASEVIRRLRSLLRRGEVALQPVRVNETIGEVLALAQSDLIERGIEVSCRFSDDLPLAVSDRVQLQQVLINMVTNACDAMVGNTSGDRVLTLATFLDGAEVRIDVLDLGPGLSGDAEDLFKPFRTSKPHGLGMGLAISRALVTAHGGRLWAGSNGDRGAAFHIALPVASEAA
jgi:PAS domain S-box-containing protein